MNCKEHIFDWIGAIEAIPDEFTTFQVPFNLEKKGSAPSYTVAEDKKIAVPMKRKSGTIQEQISTSSAGIVYEVTVKWNIENVDRDTYTILERLKNGINHLIIRTFSDEGYFVRAVSPGYAFEYYEKDGMIACELEIVNTTGAQRFF